MKPWQAAVVVGGCVFAMLRAPGGSRNRIGRPETSDRPRHPPHHATRGWFIAAIAVGALVAGAGAGPRLVIVAGAALMASAAVRRLIGLARLRRLRRERQRRVVAVCDALSAELRGGLPMATALQHACGPDAELAPVVSAAGLGGDVADPLRRCARLPGAEGLRAVAAAFEVAGSSGSALADVLERMAKGLRDDEDARAEVLAALGPPRATARMLALLPIFGLALGASIGARPLEFLLGTSWGLACLAGGVGLALLGLWWVERLATAAEV